MICQGVSIYERYSAISFSKQCSSVCPHCGVDKDVEFIVSREVFDSAHLGKVAYGLLLDGTVVFFDVVEYIVAKLWSCLILG